MSEYKIVNRVTPTPAMAETIAEVEAENAKAAGLVNSGIVEENNPDVMNKPLPVVSNPMFSYNEQTGMPEARTEFHVPLPPPIPHVGDTFKFVGKPETAEGSRAEYVGQSIPPDTYSEDELKALAGALIDPVNVLVSRKEFDEFKQSVLDAFKFMGYDTRKFFHE